ncbi:hypothetical protein [Caenimonas sp. SL110]|uniref:hypothetical protein n=1 Tax=Caenimonas sp. SL110 TaxID=1450524 RepID=UPI00065334D8|nr:hypothetical protein [Caenimonas sp. SL110]
MPDPVLHIVHCIDTEGPLQEPLAATFDRLKGIFGLTIEPTADNLKRLQQRQIDLGGLEAEVAQVIKPELLAYNGDWDAVGAMLEDAMGEPFRTETIDDFGGGWIYSWHVMDHVGYASNPRNKALGYGAVLRFYREAVKQSGPADEINWHFHPLFPDGDPLKAATSYTNSYAQLNQILARRLIDHGWFPVANRPGFHSERPDSHAFLEQWIPFDYANQSYEEESGQKDLRGGRFGDWRRAPSSWVGYRPSHRDYQQPGDMNRHIFRCLNVGTRFRELGEQHVDQAFEDARRTGSAILAFADHDYRDIRPDVRRVREMVQAARSRFPDVKIRFSGAVDAARAHLASRGELARHAPLALALSIEDAVLSVRCTAGECFGPQPFLAYKTKSGLYIHDNFDLQEPERHWTYIFDSQTVPLDEIESIAVASAGADGSVAVTGRVL